MTSKKQTLHLRRSRRTFEFLVRYPHGISAINGYRRAARHFGLHTQEDPTTVGNDTCRLFIHKSPSKLREAARRVGDAYASGDDSFIEQAETWLAFDSDVNWFAQDWKYWDQDQDEGALKNLGWERIIVERAHHYRVTLRLDKKA
jgi:hypothetical protein